MNELWLTVVSSSAPETLGVRLALPTVTLCAAASVNVSATLAALGRSLDRIDFAECLFFTDAAVMPSDSRVRVVHIEALKSAGDYSTFILHKLVDHIGSAHCLIVQWDGFVIDPSRWDARFLEYDYIGAPWPQFADEFDVGNGGFSLRSRKLLGACQSPRFSSGHPEDVAICRSNRRLLEAEFGIRFAENWLAERFSFERTKPGSSSFGFHGVFNMISVLGPDHFWDVYCGLDDRSSAFVDYRRLMRQLSACPNSLGRRARLTGDFLKNVLVGR